MKKYLSFDDVLLVPKFSNIVSRKDVNVVSDLNGMSFFPVVSSNMDSVTGSEMSKAMTNYGGASCLHRFQNIEENVKMFFDSMVGPHKPWVSVGIGKTELDRAKALYEAGADTILIDVAHGANTNVVDQVRQIHYLVSYNCRIIVGNFSTAKTIQDFNFHLGNKYIVTAFKVGIGGGSSCTTRLVTGVGVPTFSSVVDCVTSGANIIADGGIRNSGDFAKALASGAKACMIGGMLAGSDESPGEVFIKTNKELLELNQFKDTYYPKFNNPDDWEKWVQHDTLEKMLSENNFKKYKKYRGSASNESYEVQGKSAGHRTPEGESFLVPHTGPVLNILQKLEAGLRSSMSYCNATDLKEFKENAEFIEITQNGVLENKAHGKSDV